MPAVCRLGDVCTGHGCFPSRPNIQGAVSVFVNGISLHRQGDAWPVHCCDDDCHSSVLARGSHNVFCEGMEVGRVGDPVACGSHVAQGSYNVYCGDGGQ